MAWDPKHEGLLKIDGLITYLQSMDWSELWLYCLIGFHLFLFTSLYFTRRSSAIQSFTFVLLLLVVYMAEDINEYLAKNHKIFTKHQYFDSSGMFISIVMSTPFLLASCFIVGNWFYTSTQLMTEVKIMQIERQEKAAKAKKSN